MFGIFRNKSYPIGIDLGGSSLKMLQLTAREDGLGLQAAARAEVPTLVQGNAPAMQEWFISMLKELLGSKPFKGRQVVTCLPAREMLIQHLRMVKMDEADLQKALPWEAQGKVPFDINHALLRHIVAGEVYDNDESKLEVILMAASRNVVEQHLRLIERTRIETKYVNVEPVALVNCFAHLLGKGQTQQGATMFVDLGHSCSKVVVSQGTQIVFCRSISIGGEHLARVIGEKLGVDAGEAAILLNRWQRALGLAQLKAVQPDTQAVAVERGEAGRVASSTTATLIKEASGTDLGQVELEAAAGPTLQNLCEEIRSCVRYHDLMFHAAPAARVIFLGGQAKNKGFCQKLARGLGLPAQLGDPLARVSGETLLGEHSDLEENELHSEWAVAFGLSLGGMAAK